MQDNRFAGGRLRLRGTAALLGLAVLVGGCASIRDHRGYLMDRALVDSVSPRIDNKLSVERTLGHPTFQSQFGTPAWYYVAVNTRQAPFRRPYTDNQSILKITFDSAGNVASVSRSGIQHVVRLDPDGHKTPTLGRSRSFLEDLFGNIGTVGAGGAGGPPQTGGGGTGPNGS